MLLSFELQLTPQKKKKLKKTVRSSASASPTKRASASRRLSGTVTPVVSILRPDGTKVSSSADVSQKGRSLGSDGHLGSGTLTPRVGGAERIEADDPVGVDLTPKKKKGKDKHLTHSHSVPQLKIVTGALSQEVHVKEKYTNVNRDVNIVNAQTHAVNTKRARLQGLAKQLQKLFLGDRSHLGHVLKSLGDQRVSKGQRKKGKRKASESSGEERVVLEDEEEDLDPRGRPPRDGDPLVHIFIDQ